MARIGSGVSENKWKSSIQTYMQNVSLEEYTLYKHTPSWNEIVWEFYVHLQLEMNNQLAYSIVKDREILFPRAKILRAIPISDVPEEELPFTDRVNEILSGSQRFWVFYININDYGFSKKFLKVGYFRKPFVLVNILSNTRSCRPPHQNYRKMKVSILI